jgi:hypothetical protein
MTIIQNNIATILTQFIGCQVEELNNRLFLYLGSLTPYSMSADGYDSGTFVIATLTALMFAIFFPHVSFTR